MWQLVGFHCEFCRCFVQKMCVDALFRRAYSGMNRISQRPHRVWKTHHLSWCQSSSLCPSVSSCPGVPGAGHVCSPPGSPQICWPDRALPELPGQEQDGIFPMLHNHIPWAAWEDAAGFWFEEEPAPFPGSGCSWPNTNGTGSSRAQFLQGVFGSSEAPISACAGPPKCLGQAHNQLSIFL